MNFENVTTDIPGEYVAKQQYKNAFKKVSADNYPGKSEEETFNWCLGEKSKKETPYNGYRNTFVAKLALMCNEFGVSKEYTLSECISRFAADDFDEDEITTIIKGVYSRKHSQHGSKEYFKKDNQRTDKTDKSTSGGLVGESPYGSEKKNESDWSDPEDIAAPLAPVQKLTPDMLPESFEGYNTDVAERMRCPLDFTAVCSIVMSASLIGTKCGIKPKKQDDWLVIPNLWGGIVAPPSSLKTPSMAEILKMADRLIAKAKVEYEQALREHLAESIEYEATLKVYKAQQEQKLKSKAIQGATLTLPEKPEAPKERRYQTNDSTVEKLGELLNENPRGLLVFRDELTGLLTSWDRSGHEQDRAFYLEAWNGTGSQVIDRIGRGTVYVKNVCISLLGGIQPTKLAGYMHNSMGYENDGFVQRLQLLVYPDPEPWELVDRYPNKMAKDKMWNTIQKMDEVDFNKVAFTDEYEKFPYLRFADDAQEVFNEWLKTLELTKLRNSDEHPIIIEHLAKYRSLMPSLALIFHLIDYAEGKTSSKAVSLESAQMAVKWCDYLETHARRLYQMVTHPASQSAKELSKKILSGKVSDGFTARDIYRKEWYLLNTPEATKTALDYLVDANWLRVEAQPKTTGRPPADKYLINPKILQKV